MRLPTSVLSRVRGPVALLALVGCAGPTAAPVSSEPAPVEVAVPVAAVAPDPVAYDHAAEAERLARLDVVDTRSDGERSGRIDRATAQARSDRAASIGIGGGGSIGISNPDPRWMAACGRG